MATKAKRKTTPKRSGTKAKRKNPTATKAAASRKTSSKQRGTRRRPNPGLTAGLSATAATALQTVLGMTALGVVMPMVPPLLGVTPIGRAAQVGGLGWLAGYGLKRFGFRQAGDAVQLGGAVLGASILIETYVAPMIRGAFRPAPAKSNAGMQGIAVTGYPFAPPALMAAPMAQPAQAGVNGIAAYPRRF